MSASVVPFPTAETLTADQALDEAKKLGFDDVLVLGYVDGHFMWRTSRLSHKDSLWLIECMRKRLMEDV